MTASIRQNAMGGVAIADAPNGVAMPIIVAIMSCSCRCSRRGCSCCCRHAQLPEPEPRGIVERLFFIDVLSFDWNCPKYITPRYNAAEVEEAVVPLKQRIVELEAESKARG